MVLSKSNYMQFLRHPAWLWLEKHDKSKLPPIDEDTQAMFDMGNAFEVYAEKLFPGGVTLGYTTNGIFDWAKYQALPNATAKALETGDARVLFQGRMEVEGITCIFDVLECTAPGRYNLYEIKSSTSAKPEHEYDLAFQTTVLERAGLTIENIYVIHINNAYVRQGAVDHRELTTIAEVSTAVRGLMDITAKKIEQAKVCMTQSAIPDISPRHARLGSFSTWLDIYKHLRPDIDTYSIYNLHNPGAQKIADLENRGITSLIAIPDDVSLTVKQHHQVVATRTDEQLIQRTEIQDFLKTCHFPLYFLDYETFASGIPAFDGVRPYQQIPFQYSLHKLTSPTAEMEHVEYLHIDATFPVKQLAEKLQHDIGHEGTVLVWYEKFEKSCNSAMGAMVPEYNDFFVALNDRIVDLMLPFAEGWFVDKDFFGSASIKAVLPVLVPQLRYTNLAIQNGQSAQRVWMKAVLEGSDPKNKNRIMSDLRTYCTLDTLAMVEIWKVLRQVLSKE